MFCKLKNQPSTQISLAVKIKLILHQKWYSFTFAVMHWLCLAIILNQHFEQKQIHIQADTRILRN